MSNFFYFGDGLINLDDVYKVIEIKSGTTGEFQGLTVLFKTKGSLPEYEYCDESTAKDIMKQIVGTNKNSAQ